MPVKVLVGMALGDCGKGKITDLICSDSELVVRCQGGGNAGHTVIVEKYEFKLHHIPSGVINGIPALLGAGMVINPKSLCEEIEELKSQYINTAHIFVDGSAHINLPYLYSYVDTIQENGRNTSIGTTKKGIGPAYSNKYSRYGMRFWELDEFLKNVNIPDKVTENDIPFGLIKRLSSIYEKNNVDNESMLMQDAIVLVETYPQINLVDGKKFIREYIKRNSNILIEGAQGFYLDIDYGQYPFVTSSYTTSAGACLGTGIGIKDIGSIIGVTKAYSTYVGNGAYPAEAGEYSDFLREKGHEYGATTGRPRRCGWLDLCMLKDSVEINSIDEIAITKLDVLTELEKIKVVTKYELNGETINYIPSNPSDYAKCKPIYQEFDGWGKDIKGITNYNDLPDNVKKYLNFIEQYLDTKITIVSTGPERNSCIFKN